MRSFLLEKKNPPWIPIYMLFRSTKRFCYSPAFCLQRQLSSQPKMGSLKWPPSVLGHNNHRKKVKQLFFGKTLTSQSALCVCYTFILTAARMQEHSNHPGGLQWLSVDKWQWMSFLDFLVIPLHCLLDKVILPASHAVCSRSNVKAKEIIHFF